MTSCKGYEKAQQAGMPYQRANIYNGQLNEKRRFMATYLMLL
jgi:hypothetical protein